MAKIKPFRALRYLEKAGKSEDIVCPPYDIISESERLALLKKNPYNLIRLELPKGEKPYDEAAEITSAWLNEGIIGEDEREGIYIYEEKFEVEGKNYSLKGFVSLVRLYEFSENVVLPHEETLSKAKQDRFNLMTATGCSFSQIYSLYMDEDKSVSSKIEALSGGEPDISFQTDDGIVHNLWCVYDKEAIEYITDKLSDKKLYIADGHHRYETALNYARANSKDLADDNERTNYCMMMLVNMESDGLVVFPTHRIIYSLESFDLEKTLKACEEHFEIKALTKEEAEAEMKKAEESNKKAFTLYTGNGNYTLLTLKNEGVMAEILSDKSRATQDLDVSVLHSLILERLFSIDKENMANQKNLRYTRDIDEAVEAVDNGEANCSFIINATRVTQIRDVALAGEKMPQKSTYFYPKIITGLVMNKFADK